MKQIISYEMDFDKLEEKVCIQQLEMFDDAYYNEESKIPDSEYDKVRDIVQKKFPDNPYFHTVGAMPKGTIEGVSVLTDEGTKVKHDIPMLSQAKVNSVEGLIKWVDKVEKVTGKKLEYIMEGKLDGVSCDLQYIDGELYRVATRGNGEIGEDKTDMSRYITAIPRAIPIEKGIVNVRGELYIPKSSTFVTEKRRNVCSGLLNRKETGLDDLKHIKFIAFQLIYPDMDNYFKSEDEKLEELDRYGFEVIDYFSIYNHANMGEIFKLYIEEYRDEWDYETDGMVVTVNNLDMHDKLDAEWVVSHHHHYNIAIKPPSKSAQTKLLDIEWNISRNGNLIPVAIFEPIVIDGVTIQRATLNNYKNVIEQDLAKEDIIEISRANDVIPYFNGVISKAEPQDRFVIENCPICCSLLMPVGVHIKCVNPQCPEQQLQKIVYYCKKAEMDGVAEATLRLLFDADMIESPLSLYYIKEDIPEEDVYELEGMGKSKFENLLQQIEKSRTCTVQDFITRLGIESVGKKALKKLHINTIDNFDDFKDDTYSIGREIIKWKEDKYNSDIFFELLGVIKFKGESIMETKGHVAMTGKGDKGRKELVADIEAMGYEFDSSVNSNTNILICEDVDGSSSKLVKARKQGIQLMAYNEFFEE